MGNESTSRTAYATHLATMLTNAHLVVSDESTEPTMQTPFFKTTLRQLEEAETRWTPADCTTFVSCPTNMGLGFMQGTLTLDATTESCAFVIKLNLRMPAERQREAERFIRRINKRLIVQGFELAEDGWIAFASRKPLHPLAGDDIDLAYRRALITCLAYANDFYALICGAHAWELEGSGFAPDSASAPLPPAPEAQASSADVTADEPADGHGEDAPDEDDIATLLARLIH